MAQKNVEPESVVEAYLTRVIQRRLQGYTMKLVPSDKGAPDRLVLLPCGIVRLVEVKREGGQLSPAQKFWHQRAEGLQVPVDVVVGRAGVDAWAERMLALLDDVCEADLKNTPVSATRAALAGEEA